MFNRLKAAWTVFRSWESPAVSLTNPAAYNIFSGQPTLSGQAVTKDTVFALPAFLHGVDLISSTIAGLPLYPYKTNRYNGKEIDQDHQSYPLLCSQPNEWQTPFEYRRHQLTEAIVSGNHYSYVDRDDRGRPLSLTPLDPEQTGPVVERSNTNPAGIAHYYVTRIDNKDILVDASNIVHIKGLTNHCGGHIGMKLIDVVKESLGLGLATIKFGSTYFRHAGVPSIAIEVPTFIRGKEKVEEFRQGFESHHEGYAKAHRLMILQGGAKLSQLQNQNAEAMQFLESRKMSITDIASILKLPARMLNGENTAGVAYGNLQMENLSLIQYSFKPWMTNVEQQLEKALLTENEKSRHSRCIKHNHTELIEDGRDEQIANWTSLVNNGLCLPNEAAAALGLPLLDEADNVLRIPNSVTLATDETETEDQPADTTPNEQETTQDDPAETEAEKLRSLTESVLRRFLTRLQRSAEKAAVGPDWSSWLASVNEDHGDVLRETLAPLVGDDQADTILGEWTDELRAVTRDQVETVFARIDLEALTKRILA